MKKRNISFVISNVVFFAILAKLAGFFREIALSYCFGASGVSDAYLISQTIPGTVFQFVGVGINTCFIPIYYAVLKNDDDTIEYTNSILSIILAFSAFVVAITWLFTPIVVKVFASGFEGETLYYAIWFTRISITLLFFSTTISVYISYLNANKMFAVTAFSVIPYNVLVIVSIFLGAKINIWLMSVGSVLSAGIQLLFLAYFLNKTQYKVGFYRKKDYKYTRQFIKLLAPVLIGVSISEVNTLVDRSIASLISVGGISALTYANSLVIFIQGILVQPIITVFYPRLAESVTSGSVSEARNTLNRVIKLMLGLLVPITVGYCVLSEPLTKIAFSRGAFDENAIRMTSISVFFYALSICFVGIRELLSRYYYACSDTKIPMINSTIGVIINILFNLLLSRLIGIAGLPLATTFSAITTSVLLLICLQKKSEGEISLDIKELFKVLFSSVVMGVVVYLINRFTPGGILLSFLSSTVVGIIIYFSIGFVLKIEIASFLIDNFAKKIIARKNERSKSD